MPSGLYAQAGGIHRQVQEERRQVPPERRFRQVLRRGGQRLCATGKYIDIPLLDINAADSAAFDALPGIGGYFAAKMVEYRQKLGGYSYKEQLLEIYHMDAEKYSKFVDLITIRRQAVPFRLWSMPPDSMRLHPYIRSWQTARAVELYRKNNPHTMWTIKGLQRAGILDEDAASRLSKCRIAEP